MELPPTDPSNPWAKHPNKSLHFPADHQQGEKWSDAYWQFCKDEEKKVVSDEQIDTDVSWKEVPWDTAREQVGKQLLENETKLVSQQDRAKFEEQASDFWEKFYKNNKNKFFKDRNYLHHQFPCLQISQEQGSQLKGKVLMEAGCGTGSTLYPLFEAHPEAFFFAFDFSSAAVDLVKKNPLYTESRCKAFVCDLTANEFPDFLKPDSIDYVLLVFVLSAIAPEKFQSVLRKLHQVIKPGGAILFRDYGMYDMTQLRFVAKEGRKLADNYYVRADGTRTYYFTTEKTKEIFAEAGFQSSDLKYDTRELRNRKRMINMYRVWVNGTFVKT